MQRTFQTLEFHIITNKLQEYCYTEHAKKTSRELIPYLSEGEVRAKLRETSEARKILDTVGTPPLVTMKEVDELIHLAKQGGMLLPEQLEYIGIVLTSVRRLKDFLEKSKQAQVSLAYYADELNSLEDMRDEIQRNIRAGGIDDYASNELRDIRRSCLLLEGKIKDKAEAMLRNNKECYSDSFVVNRSGHICLPVKKEHKGKISGSVIDKSSTGATLFIEPASIAKMNDELCILKIDESNEERKILYTLSALLAEEEMIFTQNMRVITKLDFIFAKGKLSEEMGAREPIINTKRYISIEKGRHPLLNQEECVPLDFELGKKEKGIVITGPNTGGKTVAIKTVGLLNVMAQAGLHIPCENADICMNSQVLCDIGDGQNITENLSTFSAHITNVLDILQRVNAESLVILDELGSGTDPAEGMGIAIAILEQMKKRGCLFIATTHYPEVKIYAEMEEQIQNARMAFDRETLKPLYQLELGKAGESCALHIAKRLGMPKEMIERALKEAYGTQSRIIYDEFDKDSDNRESKLVLSSGPVIRKKKKEQPITTRADKFQIGDSVIVYPEKKIGIVCKKANEKGEILIQQKKQKSLVNHKRLKLQVAASELYPEDYDFSIIFDSVENRKSRHKMEKKYCPDIEIRTEEV